MSVCPQTHSHASPGDRNVSVKEVYYRKNQLHVRFEGTDKEFYDYMLHCHGIDLFKCKETRWSRFVNWLKGTQSVFVRLKQQMPPETSP